MSKNITQKKYLNTNIMLKKNMEYYDGTNRKIELKSSNLPRRIAVNDTDIFDERKTANEFNAFFTNIGSK